MSTGIYIHADFYQKEDEKISVIHIHEHTWGKIENQEKRNASNKSRTTTNTKRLKTTNATE